MKFLLLLMILISNSCPATQALQANWKSVSLVSNGPVSVSDISLEAKVDSNNLLFLHVRSSLGDFDIDKSVSAPRLNTITIAYYSSSTELKQFDEYFVICLFVGNEKKANIGTEENPNYDWSYDRAVYTFTPGQYKFHIQAHDGTLHISDCDPGMGM
ncbi:MAG: hypothetical protein Q8L45_12565 [Xanthomonadaceae bacterium]|nr:hypothetical protein [Xanthomonadaceae bacterium]MDP2184115.1 hypothetical protein [Xanthomonadales bacterium]MDZ4116092.1 hypothetical protein [Xanthomonadaceae bacterium]MDZ4377212.1 hypothetical protein [Xanthomonadaceae bacterium]